MRHIQEFPQLAEPLTRAANEWAIMHPGATRYISSLLEKEKKIGIFCSQLAWMADHMFGLGDLKADDVDLLVAPDDYHDIYHDLDSGKVDNFMRVRASYFCQGSNECQSHFQHSGCGDTMQFDVSVTRGYAGQDKIEFMYPYNDIVATYQDEEKPVYYSWYPTESVFENRVLIPTILGDIAITNPADSIIMYGIRQSFKKSDQRKALSLHCLGQLFGDFYSAHLARRYDEVNISERVEQFIDVTTVVGIGQFIARNSLAKTINDQMVKSVTDSRYEICHPPLPTPVGIPDTRYG